MHRKIRSVLIAFAVVLFKVDCQFYDEVQSPCPGIFAYQSDGNSVHGYITLKSTGGPVNTVNLRANFTVAARLSSTYIGRIEGIGSDALQKFNRGLPLQYRVHFPVTSPLPRLTAIVVNGQSVCYGPGDIPGPNQYVTTLSLDHMLFLKGGPNQVYNPFISSDPDIDDFVGQFGDNTQVFNVNDLGNREGPWSTGYYIIHTYLDTNNQPSWPTRPTSNRPIHSHPRPRPEYTQSHSNPNDSAFYPDTQATRPAPPPRPTPLPPPPPTPAPAVPVASSTDQRQPASAPIDCGVIAGGNEVVPLIFNGNTYSRGEWPWLVAIYRRQQGSLTFICGGTLVSDRHVVSAAHCMHQKTKLASIKDIVIKVGVYNLEDWGDDISMTRTLESATIHESFDSATLANDILILTMERTVEFNNYIRPACLWNGNTDLNRIVGASGVVAGWGQSETGTIGRGEPRMVRIPVVSTATCKASRPVFHSLTSSNTLCAGDRKGSGPCLGDSGGGLYILDNGRWRLRGIVSISLKPSNGETTCDVNEYVVFTDSAQFLPWIKKVISANLFDF